MAKTVCHPTNTAMSTFEKLETWHEAIAFADLVYQFTRKFPDEERFGLTNLRPSTLNLQLSTVLLGHDLRFTSCARTAQTSGRTCWFDQTHHTRQSFRMKKLTSAHFIVSRATSGQTYCSIQK
jgi:hypothetical protein